MGSLSSGSSPAAGAAGAVSDVAGTVTRSVGNGWGGERLLDWTGSGANQRYYGTNAHHDLTWLSTSAGTVIASLRYDPFGNPRSAVPSGWSPFRFQGSWYDPNADLSWVVSRWYAPSLGRFISEDSLLGQPADPDSRHMYAYGAGDPVGRWDPEGRWWYAVRAGDTLEKLASRYLRGRSDWAWIFNRNRRRIADKDHIEAGWCIWISNNFDPVPRNQCSSGKRITQITDPRAIRAASDLGIDLRTLTYDRLVDRTRRLTGRGFQPSWLDILNMRSIDLLVAPIVDACKAHVVGHLAGMTFVTSCDVLHRAGDRADTSGSYVVLDNPAYFNDDPLTAHEYIHVLQQQALGFNFLWGHIGWQPFAGTGEHHPLERIAYLWEGYIAAYGNRALGSSKYGDNQPWCVFEPIDYSWNYCP
jgi:RHS repeat-associated protein